MVPPPNPPHGRLASRFTLALAQFILDNNIDGEIHHPHEPIYRHEEGSTYFEPDMMYISGELRKRLGTKRTTADIVFEYLSKSTAVYDRTKKADAYLLLGVRELWLVDPFTANIEVRHASTDEGSLIWKTFTYSRSQYAKSRVLDGWEVSVDEIFKDLD
jgi:Uma2 family endonuclease